MGVGVGGGLRWWWLRWHCTYEMGDDCRRGRRKLVTEDGGVRKIKGGLSTKVLLLISFGFLKSDGFLLITASHLLFIYQAVMIISMIDKSTDRQIN